MKGYSDFVNGVLCGLAGIIWVAVTRQLVPDTNVGVAILLGPSVVLIVVGAVLVGRFRMKNLR